LLRMTIPWGRGEKQPQVLRLLPFALLGVVAQDDNSWGCKEKSNHGSFDSGDRRYMWAGIDELEGVG
jgi:hypothetical protein